MLAVVFYFALQVALGAQADPFKLVSQLSMLNFFDQLNTAYNWSSLWFIPYLLLFMLIICLLEKYVKTTKIQVLIISAIWLSTILLWVYDSPLRLGLLFSQFLPVFVLGFFISKFKLYEKIMTYKMALFAIPLVLLFSVDLSSFFNYNSELEAFKALLYFTGRSIILTTGLVLLTLLFLRKIGIPQNGFAKQVARRSAYIYLLEPVISFIILTYVFMKPDNLFFADGIEFYIYQAVRIVVLLVIVPLGFMGFRKIYPKRTPSQVTTTSGRGVLDKPF